MKFIGFLVVLGGTYGIATALGAPFGWATGIAWAVALIAAFLMWRVGMYRSYGRALMETPEYRENARRADEFFDRPSDRDTSG